MPRMKRAERRHHLARIKARIRRYVASWGYRHLTSDPAFVGHMASTHGRPCSCWMCRHEKDVPPRRERGW
jgi:hypothetical protein